MGLARNVSVIDGARCTSTLDILIATPMTLDERWFQVFYDRTATALRAYAVRVLGNPIHADDIVQESYIRFMRTPPRTDDPQVLRAFLFRIASRLIIDRWRSEKRERDAAASGYETEQSGPDIPLRLDMERVFGQLTPQQRQLLWLAYAEGACHREIAEALGLRERSVRVLLHRARRKVARLLHGHGMEGNS